MQDCLAIDLTRLITRLRHASPTGIDRVDLAYARHILSGGTEATRFGLVSTALGPRVLDRNTARGIVEAVAEGWTEDVTAGADPVFQSLAASLALAPTAEDRLPRRGNRRRREGGSTGAASRPRPPFECCAPAAPSACPRARSTCTPHICGSTGRSASTGSTQGATCGRSSSSTT
ncbi:hypothetical protein [Methylorubrum aminovorans]|uniref:hypothetical protein n=1 Tax=Methylorubrum aminovorans TaxID=269069 RepID=UPI0024E10C52|nr:hypothetical protein [Methylorubrum aminovorans]